MKFELQKHKDYWIFPVLVCTYCIPDRKLIFEIGLIKYTLTINFNFKKHE